MDTISEVRFSSDEDIQEALNRQPFLLRIFLEKTELSSRSGDVVAYIESSGRAYMKWKELRKSIDAKKIPDFSRERRLRALLLFRSRFPKRNPRRLIASVVLGKGVVCPVYFLLIQSPDIA